MANKTLNTRISLKYDTYENWSTNNPVLLSGEVAIATVPSATGAVKQAPSVLMKVGDGTNKYNDLQFVSGLAANVSSWALAAAKPGYSAEEITGLQEFINNTINDTNTTYKIVKIDAYNYKLQSKELDGEWTDTGDTIVIPKYDDTQVKADVAALEKLVGTTAVASQITTAITALKLAETYDAKGAADTALASAKAYADGKDAAIADAKKAGTDAQASVTTLAGKVGTVTEGKTVVKMIEEAKTAATYDDTALTGRVTAIEGDYLKKADKTALQGSIDGVSGKVTTLVGEDDDKSVRTIANEELTKQLIPEGANEKLDTLKEIAAWIQQHPQDAASMNEKITKNTEGVTALGERMDTAEATIRTLQGSNHTHTNKALLDTYTQTEAALADAVAKKHSHANAEVLDRISSEKVTAWDSALTDAKAYTDTLANGAVKTNTTAIAAIKDGATLDSFKDVEDELVTKQTAIEAAQTAANKAQGDVDALAAKAVVDNDTVILNCGTSVL